MSPTGEKNTADWHRQNRVIFNVQYTISIQQIHENEVGQAEEKASKDSACNVVQASGKSMEDFA